MKFHRYSESEIKRTHSSLEEAFEAGDYLLVAEHARDGSELLGAALALGGFPERGASILRSLSQRSTIGDMCLAFAFWLQGELDEARRLLTSAASKHPRLTIADELLDLINRETIHVVMIALTRPIFTAASSHATSVRPRYGQFVLRHIGAQIEADDPPYALGDPLAAAIAALPDDEKPSFIYSGTPQWFVPPDFAEIDIPKIIWMHDTDRFYYRMPDTYGAFDHPMASISQEHHELLTAAGVEGASNLLCDSLSSPSPPPSLCTEKEFDLVFTGAAFQTPQTDRARLFSDLAALADRFRILIVDGHLEEQDYHDLIGRAKFVPIINRYRGCPSPRWRDALSRGAFVLYPEGSAYRRFAPGCFAFRPEKMVEDIATHIERWNDDQTASPYNYLEQWPKICAALEPMQTSHEDIFERNLKFAAFLPLLRRHFHRTPIKPNPPAQTNWAWPVPGIDVGMFGLDNIVAKVSGLADRLRPSIDCESPEGANSIAQLDMQLALILRQQERADDAWAHYNKAVAVLKSALTINPDSMLLVWNRAHWRLFF